MKDIEFYLSAPNIIVWDSTKLCNLKCIYCRPDTIFCSSNRKINRKELTTKEVKKLISDASKINSFMFEICGGEPLLRKDFCEVARHADNKGLEVLSSTNGTLITHKLARQIKNSKIKKLQVSIDGSNAKIHEKMRGVTGSFKLAVDGAKKLIEKNVKVCIGTVITKINYNDIESIADFSYKIGAVGWRGLSLIPNGRAIKIYKKMTPSFEDMKRLYQRLKIKSNQYGNGFLIKMENPFGMYDSENSLSTNFSCSIDKTSLAGCSAGISEVYINPFGDVYPCRQLINRRFYAGNIREKSIISIWRDPKTFSQFRNRTKSIKGKCKNCKLLKFCKGGCAYFAYALSKDAFRPDIRCRFTKYTHPNLFR